MTVEKAIDVLDTVRAYYASLTAGYPKGKDCKGIGDVMCSEIANSCFMAIKALEQTRWIPCKLRLPEENGVYIVSYEDSVRLLEWFNGKWFFYPSNPAREETGTIIAWQPLPQAYKAERSDEE